MLVVEREFTTLNLPWRLRPGPLNVSVHQSGCSAQRHLAGLTEPLRPVIFQAACVYALGALALLTTVWCAHRLSWLSPLQDLQHSRVHSPPPADPQAAGRKRQRGRCKTCAASAAWSLPSLASHRDLMLWQQLDSAVSTWQLCTEQTLKGLLTHSKLAVDLGPAAISPSLYDCPSLRLHMHGINHETPWQRPMMLDWCLACAPCSGSFTHYSRSAIASFRCELRACSTHEGKDSSRTWWQSAAPRRGSRWPRCLRTRPCPGCRSAAIGCSPACACASERYRDPPYIRCN